MELPAEVLIHNEVLGVKGARGILLQVNTDGYYEMNLTFGERVHSTLLQIEGTVVISQQPEETTRQTLEIER